MNANQIKVALINNMNNNFFAFARYLRDFGIDAHLFLSPDAPDHFHPETNTFQDIRTFNWIHTFPYGNSNKDWLKTNTSHIRRLLEGFDIIISCGLHSAYIERAGLHSDIIFPYGSDLYDLPFRSVKWSPNFELIRSLLHSHQAYYQRKAYQNARCVAMEASSIQYREPLEKLDVYWLNHTIPMFYNLEEDQGYSLEPYLPDNALSMLDASDFTVFNHSRHLWSSNIHNLYDFDQYLGIKRNDKVIRAFAKFVQTTKMRSPLLVLFEYGPDVTDSKKLIDELDIAKHVLWLPKSPRKVILLLLKRYATFGTGQFRERISAGFGGVSYEILASGVPLITHMADKPFFRSSPAIEALSVEEIEAVFHDYETDPDKYREIGKQSKAWFDQHLGSRKAEKFVHLIKLLRQDKHIRLPNPSIESIFSEN